MIKSEEKTKNKSIQWLDISILVVLVAFLVYFLIASIIWLNSVSASSHELKSLTYEEIRDALADGEDLRIIANYKYMNIDTVPGQTNSVGEQTGFNTEHYQYFARMSIGNPVAYVITSYSIFTMHPTFGPIYDYGKLRIYENESYELVIDYIKADDYTIILTQRRTGSLNGDKGVQLFKHTPKFKKFF